jgi:hypothetical protein
MLVKLHTLAKVDEGIKNDALYPETPKKIKIKWHLFIPILLTKESLSARNT